MAKRAVWWRRLWSWRYFDAAAIAVTILAVFVSDIVWRCIETRPPHWGMARHLWTGLDYLSTAQAHHIYQLVTQYQYYPPLVYWASLPFIWLHPTIVSAVSSNIVFIAILAASTYGIGRELWGRSTGLLAMIFVLATPMVASQFKEFQLDAPALAMVTLGLYLLIKTELFSSLRFSLLFGLVVGLGLLTKWTYLFPLALPLLYSAGHSFLLSWQQRSWRRSLNMALAAVSAYCLAMPWYIVNLTPLRVDLLQNGVTAGVQEHDPVVGSLASNVWYIKNLTGAQLDGWLTVALVIGIGFLFVRRSNWRQNLYPILTILSTLLIFTLLRNKDARYTLPMISSIGVVSTYWIAQIRSMRWKFALTSFTLAYSALLFWLVSFGLTWLPQPKGIHLAGLPVRLLEQRGYIIGPPTHEQWHQEQIFKLIAERESLVGERSLYVSAPDTIWFNGFGMHYFAALYKVPLVGRPEEANYTLIVSAGRTEPLSGSTVLSVTQPNGNQLTLTKN